MKSKLLFLLLFFATISGYIFGGEGIKGYSYHHELEFTTTKTGEFTFTLGITPLNHTVDPSLINYYPPIYIYWNGEKQKISFTEAWIATKVTSPFPLTGNTKVVIECPIYHPITRFICNDNEVTEIKLEPSFNLYKSKYLNTFECRDNKITLLNVKGLESLRSFNCSNNSIASLVFNEKASLRNINCSGNRLTTLTLKDYTLLADIYCSKNQLKELTLSGLTNLTTLECDENMLGKLDITDCNKLGRLECRNNPNLKLDLTGMKKLTYLRCVNNNLTELNLEHLENLEDLNCAINKLTRLDLSKQRKLTLLSCGDNLLTGFKFEDVPNLKHLDCQENPIEYLDVSSLKNMTSFNCSSTGLKILKLGELPNLLQFYCIYNRLEELDLSGTPKLRFINCSNNLLSELNVSGLTDLEQIYCRDNRLNLLDISNLNNLTELSCKNNYFKLSTLPNKYFEYEGDEYDGMVGKGYYFAPQKVINEISKVSYGATIDLSSEYEIEHPDGEKVTTTYKWYNRSTGEPIPAHMYKENEGKFIFDHRFAGQDLTCEMTNPIFWRETTANSTHLTLSYHVSLSSKNEFVIQKETNRVSGKKGSFELKLHHPESTDVQTGQFLIRTPEGITLDTDSTTLSSELSMHSLNIEKQTETTWLVSIEQSTLRSASEVNISNIMNIAYFVSDDLQDGDYHISIEDLTFNFGNDLSIQVPIINTEVEFIRDISSINNSQEETLSVYVKDGRLFIRSASNENIDIYAVAGNLVYHTTKEAGSIFINTLYNGGIYIVKGSSGWVRKIRIQ